MEKTQKFGRGWADLDQQRESERQMDEQRLGLDESVQTNQTLNKKRVIKLVRVKWNQVLEDVKATIEFFQSQSVNLLL